MATATIEQVTGTESSTKRLDAEFNKTFEAFGALYIEKKITQQEYDKLAHEITGIYLEGCVEIADICKRQIDKLREARK